MSWLDRPSGLSDPAHYTDAADGTERLLRADAARHFNLLEFAPYGETTEQTKQFKAQAAQLATKWGRHESVALRTIWQQLQNAITQFDVAPEQARRQFQQLHSAAGTGEGNSLLWRSWRQAAELTGHFEPGITGSEQDSARWQPVERPPDLHTVPTALERALGATTALLGNDDVDAIISGQNVTASHGTSARAEHLIVVPTQRQALQTLQDLYAEHTRTAESHSAFTEYSLAKVDELEGILANARQARVAAAHAGAPVEVIRAVQQAGIGGAYWHEGPGDPRRHAAEQSPNVHAIASDAHAETGNAPDRDLGPPDPSLIEAGRPGGGAEIDEALQAAVAESEHADWSSLERHDANPARPTARPSPDLGP
ncbi:hypothetical protein [Nocardia brasiliensis]|uniref:hypothetical protein n=1 Tax=Nocardia brasiliensis TaxID=37326 RepID=UPI002455A287|nr:hypothetical protein [Nocardia brasiliensis]